MSKHKLYRHASVEFGLPAHVGPTGEVTFRPAGGLPLMYWPDGRWCFEASLFMGELAAKGLSRRYRGGTLLTYAAHITPLLRYCHANTVDLLSLTDTHFRLFMSGVVGEQRLPQTGQRKRTETSSIQVGRTCLRFLHFLSEISGQNLVGADGQIRAEQRTTSFSAARNGRARRVTYWHHSSFPTPSPKRKRLPIASEVIAALRGAVAHCSKSVYQKKRRYIMLKLLEITGGRRSEVAALTVRSVLDALNADVPMLKLITVKGRGGQTRTREIPVARHDLVLLKEFIDKNRAIIIRRTCGKQRDQGVLLVSETTGEGLQPNTITQEIATLLRSAGIEDRASPHMFRHRFITKLFVALIEQHRFDNPEEFRNALISTEDFKRKVLEWTGHRSIASLEDYLHLAFHEITGVDTTIKLVHARAALDSFAASLSIIELEMREGEDPTRIAPRLRELVRALQIDIRD